MTWRKLGTRLHGQLVGRVPVSQSHPASIQGAIAASLQRETP
ncbi:MAG: hypothetical protein AAFY26_06010 [Cyanobacteria bacterium J06638_22]